MTTENDAMRELVLIVERFGHDSTEAKEAAIAYCRLGNLDPHFKYPIQSPLSYSPTKAAEPSDPSYIEEWQRLIGDISQQLAEKTAVPARSIME